MEERNQPQMQDPNRSPLPPENMRVRKKVWVIAAAAVAIIILIGGYFIWANYLSPEARYRRKIEAGQKIYEKAVSDYQKELREDTYGGKTPEETLKMFVEALRKEDIELASKYFFVNASGDRSKWINLLNDVEKRGYLKQMSNDLGKYDEAKKLYGPYYIFAYKNDDGTVGLQLTMILNEFAGIWKIESL